MYRQEKYYYGQNSINRILTIILVGAMLLISSIAFAMPASALKENSGSKLFEMNCAGCHINGGNIIRRGKSLKLNTLKQNGIDNPEAIARIAREGIGIMSGYEKELGQGGDLQVAIWILEQAQKAWIQG